MHPSTASVPITVFLYHYTETRLLCGFNVLIKGLTKLTGVEPDLSRPYMYRDCTLCSEEKHPLFFSSMTLRKSNQFE